MKMQDISIRLRIGIVPGANPDAGRTDLKPADGRWLFRRLQMPDAPTGLFDPSRLGIDSDNLREGLLVICRMIAQSQLF